MILTDLFGEIRVVVVCLEENVIPICQSDELLYIRSQVLPKHILRVLLPHRLMARAALEIVRVHLMPVHSKDKGFPMGISS